MLKHFNRNWLIFWAVLPLGLSLIAAGLVLRQEGQRYTAQAFTAEAVTHYSDYDTFMTEFKQAVFAGDDDTVMALQGLSKPVNFRFSSAVSYKHPLEAIAGSTVYPYEDTPAWYALAAEADFVTHRFGVGNMGIFYDVTVERVNGRWVVTPRDAHYLLHSGQWRRAALIAAGAYYAVYGLTLGGLWVVRETAVRNKARFAALAAE